MIHQELLRRAVSPDDQVLQSFVEHLAPPILTHFASVPALGGSGKPPVIEGLEIPAGLKVNTAQDYARLTRGGKQEDQSMATHLLNGIFAAMRLTKWLPEGKQLTDLEKRLWILGYICHDYTKIYGIQIAAGEIPLIKELIERLGTLMNFDPFLPNWRDYLGDIAFLAQNTQTKEGSNLHTPLFQPKHDLRRLNNILRTLSSIADVLVHIKSPAEIAIALERSTDQNLREKMVTLFGDEHTPRFTYHKLTEVRGLLSNIINNVVMDAISAQGAEPFLFFPNGVVYVTSGNSILVDKQELSNHVWEEIVKILTGSTSSISESEEGFELGYDKLKGILKLPDIVITLYDYDPLRLLRIGIPACMKFAAPSVQKKLEKIGKGSLNLPYDRRVHQLGTFLHYVDGILTQKLFPSAPQITERLLEILGISDLLTVQEAKQQKGGSPYGWFYAAALFMTRHSDINPARLLEVMDNISTKIAQHVLEQKMPLSKESVYRRSVIDYVQRVVEVFPLPNFEQRFANELGNYTTNKSRKKHTCSLCSSPYTAFKQEEQIAIFTVQQYSNKNPLGGSDKRGICAVCTVELMLRQVQQQARKNEANKNFQEQKPVYFWIYPTYFFTTETASVIRDYIREIRDLFMPELCRYLQKNGFSISSLLNFDGFIVQKEDDHAWGIVRQKYDEHDMAGLFSFAVKPIGKDPSDTDAWIIPAFHALFLPLLLDVKVVATSSFVPLFSNGAEFPETALLDAPHQFTRYALGTDRFRVDELPEAVIRLLRLYDLHLDVFGDNSWGQINGMVKDLVTNPYYVFYYLEHKKRKENLAGGYFSKESINRYLQIYQAFGGIKEMGLVGKLVRAYTEFYEPKWDRKDSAYAILKPLLEAADTIVASKPDTDKDTLIELVSGAVGELMQRVWANNADGRDPIVMVSSDLPRAERIAQSMQKQAEFARFFVEEVFYGYCKGDRGELRENMSVIRGAARFEYLRQFVHNSNYTQKEKENV